MNTLRTGHLHPVPADPVPADPVPADPVPLDPVPHDNGHRYLHADSPYALELERLRLLEGRYDAATARRVRALGPLAGARCLEVGAGAGSVARLLAAEVGPAGSVVATDRDPRFLAALDLPNVEVRRHDVVAEDLEESAYDLVHCRALLLHLSDPARALARMAAALRPGGWLLVEDADYSSFMAADPDHPAAASFDRFARRLVDPAGPTPFDAFFGRRLPALVDALGLEDRHDEAIAFPRAGGGVEAEFFARSLTLGLARLGPDAFGDPAELDTVLSALADPRFVFVDSLSVAAWGRRPAPDVGLLC